ncbi:uncharacterized protein DS421_18g614420 [Arachis hypogaea]|nr:uncharacterized protein DS421_18g614420 [Arachis hypogaea]
MSLLTATREEQLHRVAAVPMVFPATPAPPPAVENVEPQVLRQRQQPVTEQAHQNGSDQKFWQRQSNSGGINRSNGADLPSSSGNAGGFRGDDTSHNKDSGSETPTATSFPAIEQAELATTRRPGDGDPGGDEARWRRLSKDELLWFGDRCAAQAPGTRRRQTLVAAAAGVASTTPKRGGDAAEPCDGDWRRWLPLPHSLRLRSPDSCPIFLSLSLVYNDAECDGSARRRQQGPPVLPRPSLPLTPPLSVPLPLSASSRFLLTRSFFLSFSWKTVCLAAGA